MWSAYADVISPFWLGLYLLLVILSIRSTFTLINIIFFCVLSFVFFYIDQDLWSFAKYRLEVFIPLFISQALFLAKKWDSKLLANAIAALAILGIGININSLLGFPTSCSENQGTLRNHDLRYEVDFGCNYLTRVPYNFSETMNYVHSRGAMDATYIPGVYYGVFIHVLHRTTLADYLVSQKIWNDQEKIISKSIGNNFSADADSIHLDSRIEYVMLGFTQDISLIKSSLISKGWNTVYSSGDEYSLPIFLLQRPISPNSSEKVGID